MWGAVPCTNGKLEEPTKDVKKLKDHLIFQGMLVCHSLTLIDDELCGDPLDVKVDMNNELINGLFRRIKKKNKENIASSEFFNFQMFESTGWILQEPEIEDTSKYDLLAPTVVKPSGSNFSSTESLERMPEIGIIQQFQFSSSLQRMSVIVRVLGSNHFTAYTKGSPEVILSLSNPRTIPNDISIVMQRYTEQGYRVIAIGKSIISSSLTKIQKINRDQIEENLEFLGLVILENRLKEPTMRVINELREANLHVVMITGDNIQTAVSVAKECRILSKDEIVIGVTVVPRDQKTPHRIFFNVQGGSVKLNPQKGKLTTSSLEAVERGLETTNYRFALTGQTWHLLREYYPELISKICVRGAVFARMTSDQKQQLVLELMQLGYYVGELI